MIYIRLIDELTTESELHFKIDGLPLPENQYEGFQIRIVGNPWVSIPLKNNDDRYSNTIGFINLLSGYLYKVEGQYKINGEWTDAIGSIFPTKSDNIMISQSLVPHRGGAIN